MSVVAARVYEDRVVVAADSIIVRGWEAKKTDGNFAKLEYANEMIVGGCGTTEEISLMLQYMQTHRPAEPNEKEVLAFIVEFARWKKELTGNSSVENCYLLVFRGRLFQISGMFVMEVSNYTAIGAGEDFSNAALYLGHSPEEAVKVACALSCYVAEPVIRHEMERKTASRRKGTHHVSDNCEGQE